MNKNVIRENGDFKVFDEKKTNIIKFQIQVCIKKEKNPPVLIEGCEKGVVSVYEFSFDKDKIDDWKIAVQLNELRELLLEQWFETKVIEL
jgi:activator of HSP90 ATPase